VELVDAVPVQRECIAMLLGLYSVVVVVVGRRRVSGLSRTS